MAVQFLIQDNNATKNPRGRPPSYDQKFEELAEAGAAAGLKPLELRKAAVALAKEQGIGKVPSQKWFERRMPPKELDYWTLGQSPGEEAGVILEFLLWLASSTSGSLTMLTRSQAQWIVRLTQVAPDLHNYVKWRFARAYIQRVAKNEPTFDLDLWMAFKPWTDSGAAQYERARVHRWLPNLPSWLVSKRPHGMTLSDLDWEVKMMKLVDKRLQEGDRDGK